ncbi:MAG: diaminopimelate epimerase [Dehalococcoidia bacterium]|nr:diaminopimelate epimerase [Dehalococcoidia bacterium]
MHFAKMHGTGNDFVLIEAKGDEHDWPRLAAAMCDRHFGVGADGILLVLPSERAAVRMRVLNPDGSEPEMCGNGIRCLAKYAVERGLVRPEGERFDVETGAGVLTLQVLGDGRAVDKVRVGMGIPRLRADEIPVLANAEPPLVNIPLELVDGASRQVLPVTAVSMGNPPAVHFVQQPVADFPLAQIGPMVAFHPLFPNGVNFEVARVLDRRSIEAGVWERGAGPTLACGTGASAVMVAARLQGMVDDTVDITLPGGTLTLAWDGEGEVFMTGPAVAVFEGEWPLLEDTPKP